MSPTFPTQPDNPLMTPLLERLQQPGCRWKVHHLYSELQKAALLPCLSDDAEVQLFRCNFLMMNALYRLQEELQGDGWWLQLEALDIALLPYQPSAVPAAASPLRDYYLDWNVFWQTDRDEIEALLTDFWRRLARLPDQSKREEALHLFELASDADSQAIRRRWRELALTHHPDRGGDAETYIRLRWAWEQLR